MNVDLNSYNLQYINDYPEKYAKEAKISKLAKLIKIAKETYYNTGNPILTDAVYDIIEDILRERSPNNKVLKVGAPIPTKEKVKLPYWMGSMDKLKPNTGKVSKWAVKYQGPYFISEKLDGISALLHVDSKSDIKFYTRGNGTYGQNITHLLKYVKVPLKTLKRVGEIAIRGELIISKKTFQDKYANDNSNARSMVSGLANSKTINPVIAQDIDFVVYEIIYPKDKLASKQFEILNKLGFNVAQNTQLCGLNKFSYSIDFFFLQGGPTILSRNNPRDAQQS